MSKLVCVTPDLLISRAAMVHNHWFVGERLQSVTCSTYAWSHWDGDHSRGLRWHTECAISYGSGAWGLGGSSDPWDGYRGDDAQDGMQDQFMRWQPGQHRNTQPSKQWNSPSGISFRCYPCQEGGLPGPRRIAALPFYPLADDPHWPLSRSERLSPHLSRRLWAVRLPRVVASN